MEQTQKRRLNLSEKKLIKARISNGDDKRIIAGDIGTSYGTVCFYAREFSKKKIRSNKKDNELTEASALDNLIARYETKLAVLKELRAEI